MATFLPPTDTNILQHHYGNHPCGVFAVSSCELPKSPKDDVRNREHAACFCRTTTADAGHLQLLWWNAAAARMLAFEEYSDVIPPQQTVRAIHRLLASLQPDLLPAQVATRLTAMLRAAHGGGFFNSQALSSRSLIVHTVPCRFMVSPRQLAGGGSRSRKPGHASGALHHGGPLGFLRCCLQPSTVADATGVPGAAADVATSSTSGAGIAALLLELRPVTPHIGTRGSNYGLPAVYPQGSEAAAASEARPTDPLALGGFQAAFPPWASADAVCLGALPLCVTVFSLDGRICHQNAASLEYYGNGFCPQWPGGMDAGSPCLEERGGQPRDDTGGLLQLLPPLDTHTALCPPAAARDALAQLFRLDKTKLDHLIELTAEPGAVWEGIVRVPVTLSHHEQRAPAECESSGSGDDGEDGGLTRDQVADMSTGGGFSSRRGIMVLEGTGSLLLAGDPTGGGSGARVSRGLTTHGSQQLQSCGLLSRTSGTNIIQGADESGAEGAGGLLPAQGGAVPVSAAGAPGLGPRADDAPAASGAAASTFPGIVGGIRAAGRGLPRAATSSWNSSQRTLTPFVCTDDARTWSATQARSGAHGRQAALSPQRPSAVSPSGMAPRAADEAAAHRMPPLSYGTNTGSELHGGGADSYVAPAHHFMSFTSARPSTAVTRPSDASRRQRGMRTLALALQSTNGGPPGDLSQAGGGGGMGRGMANPQRPTLRRFESPDPLATSAWQVLCDEFDSGNSPASASATMVTLANPPSVTSNFMKDGTDTSRGGRGRHLTAPYADASAFSSAPYPTLASRRAEPLSVSQSVVIASAAPPHQPPPPPPPEQDAGSQQQPCSSDCAPPTDKLQPLEVVGARARRLSTFAPAAPAVPDAKASALTTKPRMLRSGWSISVSHLLPGVAAAAHPRAETFVPHSGGSCQAAVPHIRPQMMHRSFILTRGTSGYCSSSTASVTAGDRPQGPAAAEARPSQRPPGLRVIQFANSLRSAPRSRGGDSVGPLASTTSRDGMLTPGPRDGSLPSILSAGSLVLSPADSRETPSGEAPLKHCGTTLETFTHGPAPAVAGFRAHPATPASGSSIARIGELLHLPAGAGAWAKALAQGNGMEARAGEAGEGTEGPGGAPAPSKAVAAAAMSSGARSAARALMRPDGSSRGVANPEDSPLGRPHVTGMREIAPYRAGTEGSYGDERGTADRNLIVMERGGQGDAEVGFAWHEVRATTLQNPSTGARYLLVVQKDVTAKVEAERHIAQVSECEHRLLEQIFPRHVLAYMTEDAIMTPLADQQASKDQRQLEPPSYGTKPDDPNSAATLGSGSSNDSAGSLQYEQRLAGGGGGPVMTGGRRHSAMSAVTWRPYVRDCTRLATWHDRVTVLFADVQGFTPMCKQLPPAVVMKFLNDLFVRFDSQLDKYGVYKVETIGDCYVVAGGLIHEDEDGMAAVQGDGQGDPDQADRVLSFAKAILRSAARVLLPTTGQPVKIRVGLHSGPVVSGVVGTRMPRFCLFGDTINTASRMESTGVPGAIHASSDTYLMLSERLQARWAPTGGIEVKGKGRMATYLWMPRPPRQPGGMAAAGPVTAAASEARPAHGGHGSGGGSSKLPVPGPLQQPPWPSAADLQGRGVQEPAAAVVPAAVASEEPSGPPPWPSTEGTEMLVLPSALMDTATVGLPTSSVDCLLQQPYTGLATERLSHVLGEQATAPAGTATSSASPGLHEVPPLLDMFSGPGRSRQPPTKGGAAAAAAAEEEEEEEEEVLPVAAAAAVCSSPDSAATHPDSAAASDLLMKQLTFAVNAQLYSSCTASRPPSTARSSTGISLRSLQAPVMPARSSATGTGNGARERAFSSLYIPHSSGEPPVKEEGKELLLSADDVSFALYP